MPTHDRMASAQRRMMAAYRKQRRLPAPTERVDAEVATARAITNLALRVAELSLTSGGTTSRTNKLVHRVLQAFDLPVHVDVTYSHVVLSYQPSVASDPITVMRAVPTGGYNYDRLGRIEHFVESLGHGDVSLDRAIIRFERLSQDPRLYRRWVMLAGAALMGSSVAALLGGRLADMLVAMLATILCELVRSESVARGLNAFFAQAVGASVTATLGLLTMMVDPATPLFGAARPSLVVAAGMVSMLAGIGVVTAAGDAIDGNYTSSSARIIELSALTGGIVLGLVCTLWVGLALGVPAMIAPAGTFVTTPWVQLVSAGLTAMGFAVLCNVGPRALVVITAIGVLLLEVHLLAAAWLSSPVARTGVAALVVGFLARLGARQLRIPVVAMVNCGVAPLMPGLALYRAVFAMTTGATSESSRALVTCGLTGLALAAGSSFGSTVASVVLRGVRSVRRRTAPALVSQAVDSRPPAPAQT